jgi:hypothetical protein
MHNELTGQDPETQITPKIFWAAIIVYTLHLTVIIINDMTDILNIGVQEILSGSRIALVFYGIDILEIFLLIGFLNKWKIAWFLIMILQGISGTILAKSLYLDLAVPQSAVLEIFKKSPLSFYYCMGSILLIVLLFQFRLMRFLAISKYLKIFTILALVVLIILITNLDSIS